MKIKEITTYLESIAPLQYQESYDNAGLICGNADIEVKGVLICLDSTEEIIDEAIQNGCNMVIAHHPIVFRGLKRFNGKNYVERTIIKAIKNDVAIYAIHTNLDNVYAQGVNGKIAERLGIKNTKILVPKQGNTAVTENGDPSVGAGLIGELVSPMSEMDFLQSLKSVMQTNCVRYTPLRGKMIQKVALCGGAGSFLLAKAKAQKADIFITGDFKYHEFFDAEGQIVIADIGHFESEQFTIELLYELLSNKFTNFALHCTKLNTNPVQYL